MGMVEELRELVGELRAEAETVAFHEGAEAGERVDRMADRLEERIDEVWTRELSPGEAAHECSWSKNTVARRIGDGTLPSGPSSEKRARTVRRCDLYAVVHRGEDLRDGVDGSEAAEEYLEQVE